MKYFYLFVLLWSVLSLVSRVQGSSTLKNIVQKQIVQTQNHKDSLIQFNALPGNIHVNNWGYTLFLDRCLLSDGGTYHLLLQKKQFKSIYPPGDSIITPIYIPEMELLGKNKTYQVEYHFKVIK